MEPAHNKYPVCEINNKWTNFILQEKEKDKKMMRKKKKQVFTFSKELRHLNPYNNTLLS